MKIETGYLYHIKDEYFKIVNDKHLMLNHKNNRTRPSYFVLNDENFIDFHFLLCYTKENENEKEFVSCHIHCIILSEKLPRAIS